MEMNQTFTSLRKQKAANASPQASYKCTQVDANVLRVPRQGILSTLAKVAAMLLLLLLPSQAVLAAYDYDFVSDGIYYNITSTTDLTCEVSRGSRSYRGDIVIPGFRNV